MINKKTLDQVQQHVNRRGACGYGVDEVRRATSVQDLIRLLKTPKGLEHCMEYQFPTINMMYPYRDELISEGVFIDGDHIIENPRLVIAFGGRVSINVDAFNVCEIYATNDAHIELTASDHAYVVGEFHHDATFTNKVLDKAKVRRFNK